MKRVDVWKVFVVALVVLVVAGAFALPVVAGVLAKAGDGSPVAAVCQSDFACGGQQVAVWPLPGTNAVCQSGTACGG